MKYKIIQFTLIFFNLILLENAIAKSLDCVSKEQTWIKFKLLHSNLDFKHYQDFWNYNIWESQDRTEFYLQFACDDFTSSEYENVCMGNYIYYSRIRKFDCKELEFKVRN